MTERTESRTRARVIATLAILLATAVPRLAFAGYRTMAPTVVAPGQSAPVTYEVNGSSPTPQAFPLADQIGIYQPGAPDESPLSFAYVPAGQRGGIVSMTFPATQGVYEVRYLPFSNGYHTTWTFPVMVLAGPYALTAAETVTGGGSLAVSYTVPSGAPAPLGGSLRDTIGLYEIGADDGLSLAFAFVPGGPRTGTVAITAPTTPGTYELRYQPYANGFRTVVVRRVVVQAPQPYTLSAPAVVPGDELVSVAYGVPAIAPAPLGFPMQDYVALYAAGAPDGMYLHFAYVPAGARSGTVQVLAPADGGAYELRYHSFGSGYHADATRPVTVEDSLWGPIVKIQGYKTDRDGNPDLVAIVDPSGPGATCGPFPYDVTSQSRNSKACGPQVNPFDLRSRVSRRGYTTLKTRFARGTDVIVSVCAGEKPYECTDHPPESFCRPKQGTTSAKLDLYVPPVPPAYIDVWFAYVPDGEAAAYPLCDAGSVPKTLSTAAISTGVVGDVNGDGFITATDGVQALACAAGLVPKGDCSRGNLDCAGGTTVTDGVGILRLAAGLPQDVCGTSDPCQNAAACAGKNCGQASNVCGQPIACGACAPPDSCGGGGTPNLCGCARNDAADCNGQCGEIRNRCGDRVTCNGPQCPCPSNPCSATACGYRTNCHGQTVWCGTCPSRCPQPGQDVLNATCGGTTNKECCGYNCAGVPGLNNNFKCSIRCGRANEPCCYSWNALGQRQPCNPGLSCESFGGAGRCM